MQSLPITQTEFKKIYSLVFKLCNTELRVRACQCYTWPQDTAIQRDTTLQSHQQFTPSPTHTWPQKHSNTKRHNSTKPPAIYSIIISPLASETLQVQYKETLQYKVTSNLLHHQLTVTLGFRDTTIQSQRYITVQYHKATNSLLHHQLTVLPALSSPRITTKNSSF